MDIVEQPRGLGQKKKYLPYVSVLVREERVRLGLSQVDFSKKIAIGLKTLRKIEQGDLNVSYLKLKYVVNSLGLQLTPIELVSTQPSKVKRVLVLEHVLETLKNIYSILKIKYGVCELALFGSYAKGTANIDSDIDILINFSDSVSLEIEGEVQLILENLLDGKKVDLTLAKNLHQALKTEIEESRIDVAE
jgi:uncharacterized protein